ncbi:hypothetical protein [Kurthia senegalensis]|uniref:hypothetical protein n=1 Tax=Kurthia senegalensis TaxID=1033740 RepID=UPI00028A0E56|nr:hypothetical protein [Kurthia senegalensis]
MKKNERGSLFITSIILWVMAFNFFTIWTLTWVSYSKSLLYVEQREEQRIKEKMREYNEQQEQQASESKVVKQ